MLWRLNELVDLSWRNWQDEWVVFDTGSGQTHQLDALTAATLMTIEAGDLQISELVSQVAETLNIDVNSELNNALQGILDRLVAADLIMSTSS